MAIIKIKMRVLCGLQDSLDAVKASSGTYTLDDLISIRMNAYTKQYNLLQKAYEDGTRDIYVSDGIDENGNLKYHQVTKEEDMAYLNAGTGYKPFPAGTDDCFTASL